MLDKDIKKLLEMDPVEFDQSENGWRSLVGNTNEESIASLIIEYAEKSSNKIDEYNKDKSGKEIFPIDLLYFHAGQSFGCAGAKYYKKAISCFKRSYEHEKECWNAYVNGTIAFLEGKRDEVEKQIKIIEDSKAENKRGGNIGILKNFSNALEQGITDYEKVYSMPQNV
jgi:hypothetical protein